MAHIVVGLDGELYSIKNPGVQYTLYDAIDPYEEIYIKDGAVTILFNNKVSKTFPPDTIIKIVEHGGNVQPKSPK